MNWRRLRVVLAVALVCGALLTTPIASRPAEAAGPAWYDGLIQYSQVVDCGSIIFGSPYSTTGAGTYVGFSADPETSQPAPGQVYYVRVVVAGIGNPCAGQYADINVQLPPSTSLAINTANPVRCLYNGASLTTCPQSLPVSPSQGAGYLWVPSLNSSAANLWGIPQGGIVEIQIPVVSATELTNQPLRAAVRMIDGNSSPTLAPQQGVFVFQNTPSVLAPSPSTTFGSPTWPTSIRSAVYLYPKGQGGSGYFDLRTSAGGPVVLTDGPAVIPSGQQTGYEVWSDWTLPGGALPAVIQPNTTYFWRFRFVTTGGVTYTGAEQSWTSPPADESIVGTGTPASCTGAAFAAAVAGAQPTISFDCGPTPVVIQLASEAVFNSGRTIDGANLVTLRAAPGARGMRFTAGSSHVKNLTVTGGAPASCGGAVLVSGGSTEFVRTRLQNSTATTAGGGLCVLAGANVDLIDSAVTGNAAPAGGGISTSGTLFALRSDVSANTATADGGGIHVAGGTTQVSQSALVANRAGTNGDGGGLRSVGASDVSITTSTVSGNTAARGAGVSSAGSNGLFVTSATIAANTSTLAGRGALEATTGGYLRNNLLSGNAPANCSASALTVVSLGHNLDSANTCGFTASGDLANSDARLLPVALWGGNTRTHALAPGSAAIDAANDGFCGQSDQRGVSGPSVGGIASRPIDGDGNGVATCDIGAYELERETQAPRVVAAVRAASNPTTAATVSWTVTFSETVTGFGAADIALVGSGVTGSSVASVSPASASSTFTVSANLGTGVGTVRLDVVDDDTIRDAFGNRLASSTGTDGGFAGERYDVNRPGGGGGGGQPPAGSSFVSLVPARVLETREGGGAATVDGVFAGGGRVAAGSTVELVVGGRGGVPVGASAVVVNVTAVNALSRGFVTVFPCGARQPLASNLNFAAGEVVANAVVSKVGVGGKVCVFTSASTHLVADVNGYFPAGSSFESLVPARVLETREGGGAATVDGVFAGGGRVAAGSTVELVVGGRGGVPVGASAVVVNVTAVNALSRGFVTVFPCGARQPLASNLNFAAGEVVANAVVSKVGVGGKVCVFTSASTHLVADVNGYFPAGSSFESLVPARVLETREGGGAATVDGVFAGGGRVAAGSTVELVVGGRGGVPVGASAVVVNVTAVNALSRGFVTVFPCGARQPLASNLNFAAGEVVANAVVSKVGVGGKVCVFTSASTHLVADVNGYFPAG